MDFKRIELSDKALVESYTLQEGRHLADTNFSNMFMWRHAREISICEVNNFLIIQTRYEGQNPFIFYPISKDLRDKRAILAHLIEHYKSQNLPFSLHSLSPKECDELESCFPNAFEITERRDKFEYIYHTKELIELSGRKFHKKKNHLNRFYLQYPNATFEPISAINLAELKAINDKWYAKSCEDKARANDKGLYFEHLGINDALNHFDSLHLSGGLLRNEGEIIAFSFGEMLDSTMALIHIEKANIAYSGAYQAINQALLKHNFSTSLYANREEDLGIEGLRKAKLSYQPAFLLEKYDATLTK